KSVSAAFDLAAQIVAADQHHHVTGKAAAGGAGQGNANCGVTGKLKGRHDAALGAVTFIARLAAAHYCLVSGPSCVACASCASSTIRSNSASLYSRTSPLRLTFISMTETALPSTRSAMKLIAATLPPRPSS